MILLREIQEKDLDSLEQFAQIPGFINFPNDRDLLREKIFRSVNSFGMRIPINMTANISLSRRIWIRIRS